MDTHEAFLTYFRHRISCDAPGSVRVFSKLISEVLTMLNFVLPFKEKLRINRIFYASSPKILCRLRMRPNSPIIAPLSLRLTP